jgi:tetratricopeptide (TPR) repeat protein
MRAKFGFNRSLLLGLSLLSGCAASGIGDAAPRATGTTEAGAYLIGRYAQDNDDLDLAANNLLAALQQDPSNRALVEQTFLAAMLDQRPEAVSLARQLPDSPIAQLLLGDTAARNGDWQQAQAHYAAITAAGLTQYLAPLLIAWAEQGQANTDAALATLQPKLNGSQLTGIYALHAALIADLGNRYPQAQRFYDVATSNYGGMNLRLARILANWQFRQGHQDDATDTINALGRGNAGLQIVLPALQADVKTRPIRSATDGLAEVYLSFAAELRQQNSSDTALALLRLALNLRPDLTAARLLMADTLASDKHPESALHVLATVGNNDPLSPLVRLRRADLEAQAGDAATAAAGLRQLAADMPTRPEPLAALADLEREQKQLPQAIATYDQAIARAPVGDQANWTLFFARAASEQDSGNWPSAEADLRRALALNPDEPVVLNFLGYAWADRNEHLTEARTMLSRAAELRPNDGAIIDSLGWVMLRQGDVADAVKSLERAAQMEPEDPEINGHLGDAYWAAGRKLQASYQWQLALNLKPDPAAIPKLQAKLQDAKRATGR